jgi:hypothetical protein
MTACNNDKEPTAAAQPEVAGGKPVSAGMPSRSPGKPTAPIQISYEVIGNAIVGVPVAINVVITADQGPVNVEFSITDGSALMFQSGQVERLEIVDPSSGSVQQIAVIPQREGRVYLNVSAEIQATDGLNIRSMAIPINVGSAAQKAGVNGEILRGPGGEPVVSMPADESN